jgi:hypothetical protein
MEMTTVLVHGKKRGDCKGLTPAPRAAAPSASPPLLVSITSSCDGTCRIQNTPAASRLLFSFACVCCLGRLAGLVGLVGFGRASQSRAESRSVRQTGNLPAHSITQFQVSRTLCISYSSGRANPQPFAQNNKAGGGEKGSALFISSFFSSPSCFRLSFPPIRIFTP